MSDDKSRWQKEFEVLPDWAQMMIRALAGSAGYGFGTPRFAPNNDKKWSEFHLVLTGDQCSKWLDGFHGMQSLAHALSAPWPPPPAPPREKRVLNIVEAIADDDEGGGFDQPCCFGNRVGFHAVYCHNEAWPDSPRKCRRNRTDFRHEDCPGFVSNPDYTPPAGDRPVPSARSSPS